MLAPCGSRGPSACVRAPQWCCDVGLHTGPRSLGHPGRCLAGRSTAHWVGCSPGAGWTGPGCRALVREGRLVAGLAALWAPVRPPQSPQSSRPEAGRRPFADPEDWHRASGPERKWRRGRPRTGSGKAAEGGSGRGPGGARPPAGAFLWEAGGRAGLCAGLRVCACVCLCTHVFPCAHAPACWARGPERTPRSSGEPFPHQEHSGDWGAGSDEMMCTPSPPLSRQGLDKNGSHCQASVLSSLKWGRQPRPGRVVRGSE